MELADDENINDDYERDWMAVVSTSSAAVWVRREFSNDFSFLLLRSDSTLSDDNTTAVVEQKDAKNLKTKNLNK